MKKKTRLAIWGTSIFLLVVSLFLIITGIIFGANEDFFGIMIFIVFVSLLGFCSFALPIYDDEDEDEEDE